MLGVYVLVKELVLLNEPEEAHHNTEVSLLAVALAIIIEEVVAQMEVSDTLTLGAGITVTTTVSVTALQGECGLAVKIRFTVSDVMVGVYVLVNELTSLKEPEEAFHFTVLSLLTVALSITIEEVVAQMEVSETVSLGAGTTLTTIVSVTALQGE